MRKPKKILDRILHSRDPLEINTHMDELLLRVGEIIAKTTGDMSEMSHLSGLTGSRRQSAILKRAQQSSQLAGQDSPLPPRTFLKL